MKICCLTIIEDKKNHKLLMVENLRGINKGFVNFPGGKREFNETIENSSIRESLEETGIIPINIKTAGKIVYKPADIEMYIYYCDKFKGCLKNNENETKAFWVDKDNIPYDRMRSADRIWVKDILDDKYVNLRITYNEDNSFKVENVCENIEKFKARYRQYMLYRNRRKTNNGR